MAIKMPEVKIKNTAVPMPKPKSTLKGTGVPMPFKKPSSPVYKKMSGK